MIVTAWKNTAHHVTSGSYGIRVGEPNRNRYFKQGISSVVLELEGWTAPISVSITETFWTSCPELRDKKIGQWLQYHGLTGWSKGNPPKLILEPLGESHFSLQQSQNADKGSL